MPSMDLHVIVTEQLTKCFASLMTFLSETGERSFAMICLNAMKHSLLIGCLLCAIAGGCDKSQQSTAPVVVQPTLDDYHKNLTSDDLAVKVNAIINCYQKNDQIDLVAKATREVIANKNSYLFADSLDPILVGLKGKGIDLTANVKDEADNLPSSKARAWSQVLDDMSSK